MHNEKYSVEENNRIKQNHAEASLFLKELQHLLDGKQAALSRPLRVGTMPNALVACGAEKDRTVTITKRVIDKAMRQEIRDQYGKLRGRTGHGITKEQLVDALMGIKTPVIVFRGKREDSMLIITSVKDNMGRNLAVALDLRREEGFEVVSSIRSIHGRENVERFIRDSIGEGRLLAINIDKTDDMLRSIEKRYLKENTYASFDDSIAYSMNSVKYH
ncbi:MAG: hypothetical protein IJR00_07215 [Lachnospiraceae bacterium]|nr:hypothetical protein [Lachnospiraceae bacterium]